MANTNDTTTDNAVVDLGAAREAAITKNLKAALEEASTIGSRAQAAVLVAQLAGLQDWEVGASIDRALAELGRVSQHLHFAYALSRRRERIRAKASAA